MGVVTMNSSERAIIRKFLAAYQASVTTSPSGCVVASRQLASDVKDVVEMDNEVIETMLVGPNFNLNLWIRDLKTLDKKDLVSVRDELDNQLDYASHELRTRQEGGR
jgi:hypothetical protein